MTTMARRARPWLSLTLGFILIFLGFCCTHSNLHLGDAS